MSVQNVSFGVINDGSHAESTDAAAGSGGGNLSIWTEDRQTQLRSLYGGGAVNNNSSFGTPSGVVDYTNSGWSTRFDSGGSEGFHGVSVSGVPLDADGSPISGTAQLIDSATGTVLSETNVGGYFTISAQPPSPIILGTDGGSQASYTFAFAPSISAINYTQDGISTRETITPFQYGSVEGSVTDYNGNSVSGVAVFGSGQATQTDSDGNYEIAAPGGTGVELSAVGSTQTVTPSGGQTITVDFQYARLEVQVVTPEYEPVVGANVQIGQDTYETDEDGKVVVDPAEIVAYDVLVSGELYQQADIQQQGDLYQLTFGDEGDKAGVKLRCIDGKTGQKVRDLDGLFPEQGLRALSNSDGVLSLFTDDPEALGLVLASDDRRYRRRDYEIELQGGQTAEGRVELEREQQVTRK